MTAASKTSRREFVAAAALLGTSSLVGAGTDAVTAPTSLPTSDPAWSLDDRRQAADRLVGYFEQTAPQLLRPPEGILEHPSIACSLPGRVYSTNLWDWDTYWTARGLFRLAAISNKAELRQKISVHAIGSFLNFFDHQSDEGRISIMLDVKNADPFGTLKPDRPKSLNQAKPVFGQLAQLIANETGSVDWLAPQFDKLLHFYASWVSGNQSSIGLLVWGMTSRLETITTLRHSVAHSFPPQICCSTACSMQT